LNARINRNFRENKTGSSARRPAVRAIAMRPGNCPSGGREARNTRPDSDFSTAGMAAAVRPDDARSPKRGLRAELGDQGVVPREIRRRAGHHARRSLKIVDRFRHGNTCLSFMLPMTAASAVLDGRPERDAARCPRNGSAGPGRGAACDPCDAGKCRRRGSCELTAAGCAGPKLEAAPAGHGLGPVLGIVRRHCGIKGFTALCRRRIVKRRLASSLAWALDRVALVSRRYMPQLEFATTENAAPRSGAGRQVCRRALTGDRY